MKTMRISKAAEQLNISPITLRRYAHEGRISFDTTPAGQRVFTQKHLDDFMGKTEPEPVIAFYLRDSSGDTIKLQSQLDKLTSHYGEPSLIFKDGASGLNENRVGLWRLLKSAESHELNTLAITAKDRLTRFGYKYLEEIFKLHGVKIVVLDNDKEKSIYDELMVDFTSLIASFSGKLYKIRGIEQKKRLLKKAEEILDEN